MGLDLNRRDIFPQGFPQTRRIDTHKKIRFPDKFDENEMSWLDWIKHFETVARYNEWDSIDKADNMVLSLPASCLSEIPDEKMRDYDALKIWLANRFDPAEQELSWKVKFRCRRYNAGRETIADYGRDLKKLAIKAFPRVAVLGDLDELIIDSFCNGMDDGEMKKHVHFGHPQSLDRAIALAIEYEALECTQKKSHLNY